MENIIRDQVEQFLDEWIFEWYDKGDLLDIYLKFDKILHKRLMKKFRVMGFRRIS